MQKDRPKDGPAGKMYFCAYGACLRSLSFPDFLGFHASAYASAERIRALRSFFSGSLGRENKSKAAAVFLSSHNPASKKVYS